MKHGKMLVKALGFVLMSVFILVFAVSCNDYDNTKAEDEARDYYQTENMLIEAPTLKAWIDNGYKTEKGYKVVVVNSGTSPAGIGYIPESYNYPAFANGMSRNDGPGEVGGQVLDGETMDRNLRALGIDKNTVIVITGNWASSVPNGLTRMWWTHYYWGFGETRLKILNGGNQAYAATGATMAAEVSQNLIPSTFSVKDLPGNRIDLVRVPFGDVLKGARNGTFERKEQLIISTLAPGTCFGTGGTAPCIPNSGSVIRGRIHGGIQMAPQTGDTSLYDKIISPTGDYVVFKSAEDLKSVFIDHDTGESFLPADKNFRIITHCGSGLSTTPPNFALIAILGYKNVAIYDGSLSEWNAFSIYRSDGTPPFAAGVTPPEFVSWSKDKGFFVDRNNNLVTTGITLFIASHLLGDPTWDTSMASDYVQFVAGTINSVTLTPSYRGDAREINEEDKVYQKGSAGGGSADDGSQGGGAGAGC